MSNYPDFSKDEMTVGEKYHYGMTIETAEDAQKYLAELIAYNVRKSGRSEDEARKMELSNLGYFAGYYDGETMERVNRLFGTSHPVFGSATPSAEEAFKAGQQLHNRNSR